MKPKKSIIYVFSGTGNTLKIAQTAQQFFISSGIKSKIVNLNDRTVALQESDTDTLFFFMFPSHGFMPPWSVIKYLFKYPPSHKSPALFVATRGAIKAGSLTIPGIAGLATFIAALILLLKGFKIRGMFSVDMPSNCINLHWGLNDKNVRNISVKGETKALSYLEKIVEGKSVFFTPNALWEISWSLLLLYLVPLFPVIYLLIARVSMGKVMFANRKCTSCGLCEKSCPTQAIVMIGKDKQKIPYWTDKCDVCMRCMGLCNEKAIEASHLWFIVLIFVTTLPVSGYLYECITGTQAGSSVALDFLNFLYVYPAILISYRIFFFILQSKLVKTIFTYLTLTHYYRRFFHPDIKVKDLKYELPDSLFTDKQETQNRA